MINALLLLLLMLAMASASTNNASVELISFSRSESPLEYKSTNLFDPMGMEHLYMLTSWFLDFVLQDGIPEDLITDEIFDAPLQVLKRNQSPVLSHFKGPIIVALCGLCLAALIPIIGLIVCCCRCAGRCGGQKGVIETHRDPCKRIFCFIFLFPIIIALLFGLVCAFVTNEYVEHSVNTLPESLERCSGDVSTFLVNTRSEVNTLLVTNFQQLQKRLDNTLDRSGETVKTRLGEVSKAVAVDNLTVIVSRLEQIQEHLKLVVNYTRQIQRSTSQLRAGLKGAQTELIQTLRRCSSSYCKDELENQDFEALDVITDTGKLPDIEPLVRNVTALLSNNIQEEITKGKMAFDKLSNTIQKAVNKTVPDIKWKISQAGEELSGISANISDSLYFPLLQEDSKRYINEYQPYARTYSKYRWYACLVCCCVMLCIVFCFSMGLVCGTCSSERSKNVYNADSGCSRSKGATFLLCGVTLFFLFSLFLLLVTTCLFLVGGLADRVVCDSMSESKNPQVQKIIELIQNRENKDNAIITASQVNFMDFVNKCSENATLYTALGLKHHTQIQLWPNKILKIGKFSDIKNYKQRYQIDKKLQDFLHQISINPSVTLLTPEGINLLERLRDTPISDIDFNVYLKLGEDGLTGVNLMDVSREISEKANLLPSSETNIAYQLRNIALQLESYETKLVRVIWDNIKELKMVVQKLKNEAEYGGKDLQKAIGQLLEQAKWAQAFISTKGREELRKLATAFVEEFTLLMDKYADHVQYQIEEQVGKCGPLSRAYNATLIAVCDEIVQPFNGFWASLGFCCLLCIPGLIFAIILSVLYRRVDPYPTPLVDPGHRKQRRNERGGYDNRNGIHDYSPSCPEMIPLSRSSRDFSLSSESPVFPLFVPLNSSGAHPTAPTGSGDWEQLNQRAAAQAVMSEYSKPPPYHFVGI